MFEGVERQYDDLANRAEKAVTEWRIDLNWGTQDYKEAKELMEHLEDLDKEGDRLRALRSSMKEGENPYGSFDLDPTGVTDIINSVVDMADNEAEATAIWLAENPYTIETLMGSEKMDKLWKNTKTGIQRNSDELRSQLEEEGLDDTIIDQRINQEERNLYGLANQNESFAYRSLEEAFSKVEYRKLSPAIAGLNPNDQREIYSKFIEAGGDMKTFIDQFPEAHGPKREDYEVYTTNKLSELKNPGAKFKNKVPLLGYNGLLQNPKFPTDLALQIAEEFLTGVTKTKHFEHGRIGYELCYVFTDRQNTIEIRDFEKRLEQKRIQLNQSEKLADTSSTDHLASI